VRRPTQRPRLARAIAALLVYAVAASPSAARLPRAAHAKLDLLSESPTIPPGGATTLGVRFTLDDGWHIYWRNPGESGGAPTVAWTTPPDLTVGDLEWPAPTRFAAAGDTTYGYERAVVLLAAIRAADQSGSTAYDVRARIDYQICKDVCVKETARLMTSLPVGPSTASPYPDLFTSTRATLPMTMPANWTASAAVGPQEWLLDIDTGRAETAGVFFPYQPDLIDDSAAQRIESRATGLSLHMKKSRTFSSSPPRPSLDGLLVRPGERAVEISARVR
jgi:DsbC/DsbD-like thiol-disulfide interchange protein